MRGVFDRPRFFCRLFGQLDDGFDHRLVAIMPEHHRAEHDLFGQLMSLRFDHQYTLAGAGDDQVERRRIQFFGLRIEHILPIDIADPRTGDRPHERQARNRQCRRRTDQGNDVGIVFQIMRDHGGNHLRLAAKTRVEQRPDRPVDQPRSQRFLFGRPAFAFEKAAGNLAGGECLFLVIYGEREEVQPDSGRFFTNGGA